MTDRNLSQWDTRPETAKLLVEWSNLRGKRILEPSAGLGNVVQALVAAGNEVDAVEIDPHRAAALESMVPRVYQKDFLEFSGRYRPDLMPDQYDAAVMNPPYEKGQDLAHILHALTLAPRVVVLARLVLLEGKKRRELLWNCHTLARLSIFSAREKFEGAVDGTPKSAMAFFDIRRGVDPLTNSPSSIVSWL